MAFLRHYLNGQVVNIYELGDNTLIGRAHEADIGIGDPTVSAEHARVVNDGENWLVRDLESTNGILIQGDKVSEAILHDGVIFSLGTHSFEFFHALPADLDKTLKIKKSWIPGIYYTE